VISLLVGVAVAALSGARLELLAPAVFVGACAFVFSTNSKVFFTKTPVESCAQIYRGNIFPDAVRIGQFLREHTTAADTIAVIGSEPEIYFYAHRRSATGYIYTYALMEEQRYARTMQQAMQREIEAARPKFLVFVTVPMSWGFGPWSDLSFIDWANEYTARNYHPLGAVNVLRDGASDYCLPCNREMQPWPPSALIAERNE
jgi:hypothetical protein